MKSLWHWRLYATICAKSNVKLTPEEYIEILKMNENSGLNLDKKVIMYMKKLIR